ncbi:MAG: hypothetical protein AAGA66_09385 [Bacteroidota bacterium]
MERFLIFSHIFCGGTVLLLGLINFINRKGSKNHRILGKIYVGAMWWICLSALLIISFYRFNTFLMVIAVLTFYSSFTGVRVLRRKKIGSEKWYDWAVAFLTSLFGLGLLIYSAYLFAYASVAYLAVLCAVFGTFTMTAGFRDLKFFFNKTSSQAKWWLYQHVGAISGSYIAAVTAFAVQNPDLFLSESSYQWLLWILPSVIGSPLIAMKNRKLRALNEKANRKSL